MLKKNEGIWEFLHLTDGRWGETRGARIPAETETGGGRRNRESGQSQPP